MELSDRLKESIVGYFEGKLTQPEADELLLWVNQNEENLQYFRQMGQIWHATGYLQQQEPDTGKAIQRIREKIREREIHNLPVREIRLRVSTLYRCAAAIVLLVALGITSLLLFRKTQPVETSALFVETSAPKGSRSLITLPDGTSVWLNADTKFRYPVDYGVTNRVVHLDGEAYFKVSKNKKLPFKVYTSDITVTALGTAFNVKAYGDEGTIETTLEEGSVSIEGLKEEISKGIKTVILKPNESAVFQKQMDEMVIPNGQPTKPAAQRRIQLEPKPALIQIVQVSDTRLITSWKDPRWIFKNEKLAVLVPKLERRYDVEIEFADNALKDYAFNGTLLEESLEQVLNAIRFTAPIQYRIEGKKVTLSEDKTMRKNIESNMNP